eukprot:GHVU01081879.1.p2 GENE.GHVU01081879.1~~GHVU01081879.1.p2  ORF type:complete len:199 (-),score=7.22 GHVU01081879.1:25-621(-)
MDTHAQTGRQTEIQTHGHTHLYTGTPTPAKAHACQRTRPPLPTHALLHHLPARRHASARGCSEAGPARIVAPSRNGPSSPSSDGAPGWREPPRAQHVYATHSSTYRCYGHTNPSTRIRSATDRTTRGQRIDIEAAARAGTASSSPPSPDSLLLCHASQADALPRRTTWGDVPEPAGLIAESLALHRPLVYRQVYDIFE